MHLLNQDPKGHLFLQFQYCPNSMKFGEYTADQQIYGGFGMVGASECTEMYAREIIKNFQEYSTQGGDWTGSIRHNSHWYLGWDTYAKDKEAAMKTNTE